MTLVTVRGRANARPPRILIATPLHESQAAHIGTWILQLDAQDTECLWDVLAVDSTPHPSQRWLDDMHALARTTPFAPHRLRLKRFGVEEDGRAFTDAQAERLYAHRVIFDSFVRSLSYDHLLMLDVDIVLTKSAVTAMCYAAAPWASWAGSSERALSASLLDGQMVRDVPLPLTSEGSDAGYERACREYGYPARVLVGSRGLGLTG